MAQLAAAIFDTREDARRAVAALRDHGVDEDDISVLALADDGSGRASDLDVSDGAKAPGKDEGVTTTTPEDSAKGAGEGAAIGAGLGLVAAIASIFVPGFGLVAGGGALGYAIAGAVGATAAGAIAGGVTGYLADMGVPSEAAQRYSDALKQGGILVSVHNTEDASLDEIHVIFNKYHGRETGTYNVNLPTTSTVPEALDATNDRIIANDTLLDDDETVDTYAETKGSASGRLGNPDL